MTMMSQKVVATTRPVTMKDVAEKLGMPVSSVRDCIGNHPRMAQKKVDLVRQTAKEMGYDRRAIGSYAGQQNSFNNKPRVYGEGTCSCGNVFTKHGARQIYCPVCAKEKHKECQRIYIKRTNGRSMNWHNGNFKTKEEEIARMKELREMGYSNHEIARAVGRADNTVYRNIGKQDHELWRQNVTMAIKYRAQKNAARKQYVVNKPIREYNKRVKEHNDLKAKIAQMEMELKPQIPAIEKAAQTKIEFPMMQMETVQPVALQ